MQTESDVDEMSEDSMESINLTAKDHFIHSPVLRVINSLNYLSLIKLKGTN